MQYRRHQRVDQNAVFRKRVIEYLVNEMQDMDIDFATVLDSPLAKTKPYLASRRTRSPPFNAKSGSHPDAEDRTDRHEMLMNRHRRRVAFDPKVNHIGADVVNPSLLNYETDDSPPPLGDQPSSDESLLGGSDGNASEVFEFDEPAVHNIGTESKYCELCNGSKDHNTWECKKFDSCNIPKDERRKIKQCRIRFHKELVQRRKELGLPPPPKPTTSTPPNDRPPLPRDAILPGSLPQPATSTVSTSLPDALPQPRESVISDDQKQALNNSSISDTTSEPDPAPTLAYDMNAENLAAL